MSVSFFLFKQKTAYEMRISGWSSDVCSSDLLSAVGVAVIEVAKGSDGTWSVKAGSKYNKRHTGNDTYRVGGPASGILPSTIKGTLNNCSSGRTPWGTYLTCEETTDNYLDPKPPEEGYGWVIEIDPSGEQLGRDKL